MKVWDLHCDTLYELRRAEKAGAPKSFLHNDLHIDLEKLRQGDYLLQCFAAYVDLADPLNFLIEATAGRILLPEGPLRSGFLYF